MFSEWYPSQQLEDKHERVCNCGEAEIADCTYDSGVITKEATHFEEGIKTYTCTVCGGTKEEKLPKTEGHVFGEWYPSQELEDKHERVCKCGEAEVADCTYDSGVITKEATHFEEGIKTYTCTVCGRTKEEKLPKIEGHVFGDFVKDPVNEDKHYKVCKCGEKEIADCSYDGGTFDENTGITIYTCTVCGRQKEGSSGIIIVISGGSASFEDKETVTSNSKLYGDNAKVYIAQVNDVLNITLNDQVGRTFKYWSSANGTIIPDEDFSMLVFRSGYYYPVFEDTNDNDFANRTKIYEGNCEEGILYMSTNAKGDIKYELEFINRGHHDFSDYKQFDSQYHKFECTICGEIKYEQHNQYNYEIEQEPTHTETGLKKYECYCGYEWTETIPVTDEHSVDYDDSQSLDYNLEGLYDEILQSPPTDDTMAENKKRISPPS